MRVSIVVPDSMVVVDGEARKVSMAGLPAGLHAVQWDGNSGEVEYGKPNRRNIAITDLAPFQFLVDRWMAAAPAIEPPPPPPTKDEQLARTLSDPGLGALVEVLAVELKKTPEELKAAIKDKIK